MYYFYLFLAGIAGGVLGGLLGIGGGIVFVLVLPVALHSVGVPEAELVQYTIANSLFATFFSSLSANYTLFKKGTIFWREVLVIGLCSVVTSLAVLHWVVNTDWYSPLVFNWVLLVMLTYMLARTIFLAKRTDVNTMPSMLPPHSLALTGLLTGCVSPLSGLGGGIVVVPMLNSWLRVNVREANGISLGVIGIVSFSSTMFNLTASPLLPFSYYNQGYIVFPVALALSAGVMVGSPQGIKLSQKLPTHVINYAFSALMSIILIKKVVEITHIYFQ